MAGRQRPGIADNQKREGPPWECLRNGQRALSGRSATATTHVHAHGSRDGGPGCVEHASILPPEPGPAKRRPCLRDTARPPHSRARSFFSHGSLLPAESVGSGHADSTTKDPPRRLGIRGGLRHCVDDLCCLAALTPGENHVRGNFCPTSLVGPFLVMLAPPLLVVGIALLRTSFLWEPTPTPEPDVGEDLGLLPPVFL